MKNILNILLQVPGRLKEALKAAKESLEKRLQEEQRLVGQHSSVLPQYLSNNFSALLFVLSWF